MSTAKAEGSDLAIDDVARYSAAAEHLTAVGRHLEPAICREMLAVISLAGWNTFQESWVNTTA